MIKKVIIFLSLILYVCLIIGLYMWLLPQIKIELIGGEEYIIDAKIKYEDPGLELYKNDKLISDSNYSYVTVGTVDSGVIGKYHLKYIVTYKNKSYEADRIVRVQDLEKPIISVGTDVLYRNFCTKKIENLKYTATDNLDGDITNKVTVKENEKEVILSVKDSSGNEITKSISVENKNKPANKIVLNGNASVNVELDSEYEELGASYTDGCGKKLDKEVEISGEVNTKAIGEYKITYAVDKTTTTRIVHVVSPEDKNTDGKIVYLTFDDGPGAYTKKILDTLDKYNVKATFFVTHQMGTAYESMLKEEYERGHGVAVHTYTHKWNIYSSLDAYLKDFNKINEVIKEQTGSYSNIFRFPGGSSNKVSRSYKKGIMTQLSKYMTSNGYQYFDWNVDSTDAAGGTRAQIYSHVVNGLQKCSNNCVVLMHDIKANTANELDNILATITKKGYNFKVLTADGPIVHQRLNN